MAAATSAIRSTTTLTATTDPGVGRVLGELVIDVLEDGHAPWTGRTTDELADRLGRRAGARPFYRSARRSRAIESWRRQRLRTGIVDRATMPAMAPETRYRGWPPRVRAGLLAGVALAVTAGPAMAHGTVPPEPPGPGSLFLGWSFSPLPTLAIAASAGWWLWAVARVNRSHPTNPVPRRRVVAFLLGLFALAVALLSGVERYDTTLFSIHMVQHVLIVLVAAPLLALGAPITLLLRLSSGGTRRRWLLPVLHSRVMRVLAFPVVAWIVFATVLWASHFSGLFNAALEDPLVHDLEHGLFLGSALLFWWPAVGLDPAPWRMGHPARIGYVFLQMTQNTFLSFVLLNASGILYPHYSTLGGPYGIDALADQRLAAGVMWIAGDAIFLVAIMALVAGWMRADARDLERVDRQADIDRATIRVRERRLAERLADDRGDAPS
jgi:putative copper resistance protein D